MHIFQSEYDDGLADIIKTSASVSYASMAQPCSNKAVANNLKHIKSIASMDDQDLYYVQSILVTSSWNKNDDIFDSSEVWLARNTPEDKPTNLEHDENTIIGHITANWPITDDGILIDENTPVENLPHKYHILTGSVIYRAFSSQDLRDRSEKLIAEIENGQKYVSMECLFKGFDYGLLNKSNGEYKILARDTNTAYLTKYLRSYGGMGEHENYKIGRVLRQITFSGKGFVDKPANPDSIIFTKDSFITTPENILLEKNTDLSLAGVSINQSNLNVENNIMNLENDKVESSTKECAEVTKELTASASALEAKATELENTIKAQEVSLTESKAEIEALRLEREEAAKKMKEEMTKKEEEMTKMKADLDTALETIAGYMKKEAEMMKKEKKMARKASLLEAGIDNDTAEATLDKFEDINDEAFEAIVLLAGKMPPWLKDKEDKTKTEDMKKKASEEVAPTESVDPAVLETAEVEASVNLGVGGEEEDSVESTRAALVDFVSSRLGKKL